MYLWIIYMCICWIIKCFNRRWCTVQTLKSGNYSLECKTCESETEAGHRFLLIMLCCQKLYNSTHNCTAIPVCLCYETFGLICTPDHYAQNGQLNISMSYYESKKCSSQQTNYSLLICVNTSTCSFANNM